MDADDCLTYFRSLFKAFTHERRGTKKMVVVFLIELKVIQEVITLLVFTTFSVYSLRTKTSDLTT